MDGLILMTAINHFMMNQLRIVTIENKFLQYSVAPALGGKFVSIYNKQLKREFLWKNEKLSLTRLEPGSDYDSNFWGGIDELIPNDVPENIDGIDYPDHGELWTTPLEYEIKEEKLILSGTLSSSKLFYQKIIDLDADSPAIIISYKIKNTSNNVRHFLWKLHAALKIQEGDKLITSAKKGKVADVEYSRFTNPKEFEWPIIEGVDASVVPSQNNTMDFFYLYNIPNGEMEFSSQQRHIFRYSYDKKIFPYQWYFASYGKFLDHYTAILEPCTTMPVSVNEARKLNQCSVLKPNEELHTIVKIYAG
jgi:hypothetical protein